MGRSSPQLLSCWAMATATGGSHACPRTARLSVFESPAHLLDQLRQFTQRRVHPDMQMLFALGVLSASRVVF
eukprot:977908-Pleurochrysis_carterae.AAC.5